MAILSVPTNFATIAAAVAAAAPGDTVVIEAGYMTAESVTVTVNNLTVQGLTPQTGNSFTLGAGVSQFTHTGTTPFTITGSTDANTIISSAAADVLNGGDGNDTIQAGAGSDTVYAGAGDDQVTLGAGAKTVFMGQDAADLDRMIVDWSATTGNVSGGYSGISGGINDAYGGFGNTDAAYSISFNQVEEFDVRTGSGNDSFTLGDLNDSITSGLGNDTVNAQGGDFKANLGGGTADHLLASLAGETVAITLNLTSQNIATDIGGGNFISGVEQLNLTTGSGDDVITTLASLLADSITTGAGNDTVKFAGGSDAAQMGASNTDLDRLILDWSASTGNVTGGYTGISGGADDVYGGFGNSQANYALSFGGVEEFDVKTGSGNDDIYLGGLNDTVSTGAGNDAVEVYGGKMSANLGTGTADWLKAHLGAESANIVINLLSQNLATDVGGGNFLAGVERLSLTTGSGNDVITTLATLLADSITTGAGNDTVKFSGGSDAAQMGADSADLDRLILDWSASTGNVTGGYTGLSGGTDDVYGGFSNTQADYALSFGGVEEFNVKTGSGNDDIYLGGLNDTVSTGAGNDAVEVYGGKMKADLGSGTEDWLKANLGAETGAVLINLNSQNILTDVGGGNYLAGVERLSLTTGSGNDVITTLASLLADSITTGAGNDTVRVAGGSDTVQMGADAADVDRLILDWSATTGNVTGGFSGHSGGIDDAYGGFSNTQANYALTFGGVEEFDITTGSGDDNFATGGLADTVSTGDGNDTVQAYGGDIRANLGAGNADLLQADLGGETDDILIDLSNQNIATDIGGGNFIAGVERLTLTTGSGNDLVQTLNDILADVVYAGLGNDTVRVGGGNDGATLGAGASDMDRLIMDWSASTGAVSGGYSGLSGGADDAYGGFSNSQTGYGMSFGGVEEFSVTTGSGDDSFTLGLLNDTVVSGAGNDTVNSQGGTIYADLGSGNADYLLADLSAVNDAITVDILNQDIGTDIGGGNHISGVERVALTTGAGDDLILTTTEILADSVTTGAGNDTVRVGGGSDTVQMGAGAADLDRLVVDWSGTGNDVTGGYSGYSGGADDAYGGFGNGQASHQLSFGGVEEFDVTTGAGNDDFYLSGLNDTVRSGDGNDAVELYGGKFLADLGAGTADLLKANLGSETGAILVDLTNQNLASDIGGGNFMAGVERLSLTTGSGNDAIITLTSTLVDSVTTGAGNDTVEIGGGADVVNLGAAADDVDLLIINWAAATGNVGGGVSGVSGGADDYYGGFSASSGGYSVSFGGVEAFDITAGSGDDNFSTGGHADTLDGGSGNDTLTAGDGNDSLRVVGDGNDSVFGGTGSNTLHIDFTGSLVNGTSNSGTTFTSAGYGTVAASGVTHLHADLGAGDDSITFNTGNATLIGNAGNDSLTATGGLASLDGGTGNDTLTAGAGNDSLYGGDDADVVFGGAGDNLIELGLGDDDAQTSSGNDTIDAMDGEDTVDAGDGANLVYGRAGNDSLTAGAGNDSIDGGSGNDTISSGDGDDLITASGNDSIDAGLGADTVVLSGNWADYTITSPSAGTFVLTRASETVTVSGAESFTFANGTFTAAQILNDTPVAGDDGNGADAVVEAGGVNNAIAGDATASGNVLTNDSDADTPLGDLLAVTAGVLTGTYGTLTLSANGNWTYNLSNSATATQALAGGQTYSDVFTYTVTDLHGASTTGSLTVTINGSNDAAVMTPVVRTTTETNAPRTVTGTLSFTDVDSPTTYQAQAGTAGLYGTLVLGANGSYTYTMDSAHNEFVAATQYNDVFTVTAADGTTSTLTIRITGTNDAAVIAGDLGAGVTEDGGATATDSGTATSTDVDGAANAFIAASGNTTYGSFTLNAAGQWTYTVNNANPAVQALSATATLGDSFQIAAADGTLQTVTVLITGSNDAAVFGGTLSGSVTEDAGAGSSTSGTATTTDIDGTANSFIAASGNSTYGSWTVDAAGQWTYTVNNANATVNNLSLFGTLNDSFTIAAEDGTMQVISLTINGANETITGGGGGDILNGSGGADLIQGNAGDDTINANAGNDTVLGGAGADSMAGGSGTRDTLSYATGTTAGVVINLDTGFANFGHATGDVFSGFEDLTGTVLDDTLSGSSGANVIFALGGNDLVEGQAGADTLNGGGGTDMLSYGNSNTGVTVNLANGLVSGGHAQGDVISSFEDLTGSNWNDNLTGSGSGNLILGGAGLDTLKGNSGDDTLSGETGNDRLFGGAGNDSLDGGDDADRLYGEAENDVLSGGGGNDSLEGGNDDDSLYGGTGDDTLAGGNGVNLLDAGDNNDRLTGGTDVDSMLGGAGNDVLVGFAGSDRLDGGTGNDTLNGGLDADLDVFVFLVGYGSDQALQYEQGVDRVELDDALWSATPGLTAQQVINTYGSLNGAGTILTLTFGTDILRITDVGGINLATFGSDIIIV